MSFQDTIDQISVITNTQFGGKKDFDSPVRVKPSPHSWPIEVGFIQIKQGQVWMVDNVNRNMTQLDKTTLHYELIANSILQRLKTDLHAANK